MPENFIIQSALDDRQFKINQNVIEASALLKNICDLTYITEPISVNCKSESLEFFINFINHYSNINDDHDKEFEANLYNKFNDSQLAELIQDLSILDSDFFLDSVADYVLSKMDSLGVKEIQEYLGVEDDFSFDERILMDKNKLEYFLSIKIQGLELPFKNKSLFLMSTKFSTPLNVFIARIIQRSNENLSYKLSLINKTIKNETDRHPLKMKIFSLQFDIWTIEFEYLIPKYQQFKIKLDMRKQEDKKYFNAVKERKLIVKDVWIYYDITTSKEALLRCSSLDFVIPKKGAKADIMFARSSDLIYHFDISKFSIPFITFKFQMLHDSRKEFKQIYDQIIAKASSKKLTLWIGGVVKFIYPNNFLMIYKKAGDTKFYQIDVWDHEKFLPDFTEFITNYMNDDGIVKCTHKIRNIPRNKCSVVRGKYFYTVAVVKEYLERISSKLS